MFDCSMISDDVRLSPMIRGDAQSLRLPGRFGTVCRDASGPTASVSGAAGDLHRPARATVRHDATRSRPGQGPRQRRPLHALLGRMVRAYD